VLSHYYSHDNSKFVDALRIRDFVVPPQTSANYNWTFLSLVSTLNMGYVHDLFADSLGPRSLDRSLVYDAIRDNATARFLRARGYQVVHLQSTWGATSVNAYADRQIRCQTSVYANEFVRAVVEATWLGAFHSKASVDLASCHLSNFKALAETAGQTGPKFVFAHFVLPHHPYLFDRDGKVLRDAVVSNQFDFQARLWEDREAYRDQLEFVNRLVLETVDEVLRHSAEPPIIVLVSDHGPNIATGLNAEEHYALRLASLGAYYLPNSPTNLMPDDGTAVNQFRRILSHYFDADLPVLPDRHFVSANAMPYAFQEMPHEILRRLWARLEPAPEPARLEKLVSTKREQARDELR
jgi:hypothetical protein